MKTIGIIAEYNPFHRGHAHHLGRIADQWPEALRIVLMSGAFVQRGGPAIMSKFDRARMAILGGADLVLELPSLFASAHAQLFASGAVRLLGELGVDGLSFGSEVTQLSLLEDVASLSQEESVQERCRQLLKDGLYYGTALRQAIIEVDPRATASLDAPNALLGIEYIRAIQAYQYAMRPLPIERTSQHHAQDLCAELPSGTALRQALYSKDYHGLDKYFPENTYSLIQAAIQEGAYLDPQRYDDMVLTRARQLDTHQLLAIQDFKEGLENKWTKAAQESSWLAGRETIKSKRYAYARLDRMAAYTLLDVTKSLIQEAQDKGPQYARLLAFNNRGRTWLKTASPALPLIQKWAPFYKKAQGFTKKSLSIDALANDLQALCFHNQERRRGGQDFLYSPQFIQL